MNISHPEKVLYPEDHLTKGDIFAYYEFIAQRILPHVVNRPLTLVRCPNSYQQCFYQRHTVGKLSHVYTKVLKQNEHEPKECLYIKDREGLLSLVQMDVLEIHSWGCRIEDMEQPDRLIFDLDPGPGVAWAAVVVTAKRLRAYFKKMRVFVKTTGGKGLHIVIPIQPQYEWSVLKEFAKKIVEDLAQRYPEDYVITISKAPRKGKIFLDYLRNQRSASAIAAYSTRAKIHASIAMPLSWKDLETNTPPQYTIIDVMKKNKKLRPDPWRGFFNVKQKLDLP